MSLTDPFVRRPIMTTLVMLAILGFGILAYTRLPVSDLPNVDFPTITVSASLPGANPETMASSVALPLEKQFSSIAGIDSMTSTSSLGGTTITLQFALSRNIDAAAQDVQTAISSALPDLPTDLPNPPSFRKVNPAEQPILLIAATSESLPLSDVDEYAETLIGQRFSTISGVAEVDVFGAQKFAVRVQVDPRELATRGIGIDEIEAAIRGSNTNLSTGTLDSGSKTRTIEATGKLQRAGDFRKVIIAYRNGAPIRLDQVANVINSVEDDKSMGWFNDKRGIVLAVQRQPGANTVKVIDDIRALLPTIRAQIPAGIKLDILYDRSQSIRGSLHDVEFTLVLAVALVVLVIFLFLRSLRATLIPSAAIPLSIVGTFAVMYLLGFSVNNFTLLALTLAVGFVVDDAIVVLENIVRHIEQGLTPWEAALKGGREISFTILSMTLSLAAVFIPVLFMGGILGRLLNEFAVTIAAAILVSGCVSLTLTPMLCSRYLRAHQSQSRFYVASERVFDGALAFYRRTLQLGMRHHIVVTLVAVLMAAATVWLFEQAPKGFLPNDDASRVFITTEAEQGIAFDKMIELQKKAADIVGKNPAVESFMSRIGSGGGQANQANAGRLIVTLKPRNERAPVDDVVRQFRKELSGIAGLKVYPQNPPTIRIGGSITKSLYQFTLFGPDLPALYAAADRMQARMEKIPGLVDVTSDLQITSPEVLVDIQRDKASTLGITAEQIETALGSAYGERQVSTIYTPNDQFHVILEAGDRFKKESFDLNRLYVRSPTTGRLVALNSVASISQKVGPLTVQHLGQLPAVTLSFDLARGVSLGDVVPQIEKAAEETTDPSISTQFQGTAQAFASSLGNLGFLLLMAILVIYLVLGILYESFIHPLTILSGLPSAGFGALITLWLFGAELNIYGFVGLLMLIGIVKKNAIMMIDFALDAQRTRDMKPADAIFEACLVRFRPIMMTTFAAMMGSLPIALAYGQGGDTRKPLGLVVVGGLIVSQLVTLYLTPVLYLYLENLQAFLSRRKKLPVIAAAGAS